MESSQALSAFSALSQETRLAVLKLLIRDGVDGLPAGVIADRIGVPASSLSFHVANLERAGLLRSWRVQRQIFYAPNFEGVRGLVTFLLQDCCGGRPEVCADVFSELQGGCGSACAPEAVTKPKAASSKRSR